MAHHVPNDEFVRLCRHQHCAGVLDRVNKCRDILDGGGGDEEAHDLEGLACHILRRQVLSAPQQRDEPRALSRDLRVDRRRGG